MATLAGGSALASRGRSAPPGVAGHDSAQEPAIWPLQDHQRDINADQRNSSMNKWLSTMKVFSTAFYSIAIAVFTATVSGAYVASLSAIA